MLGICTAALSAATSSERCSSTASASSGRRSSAPLHSGPSVRSSRARCSRRSVARGRSPRGEGLRSAGALPRAFRARGPAGSESPGRRPASCPFRRVARRGSVRPRSRSARRGRLRRAAAGPTPVAPAGIQLVPTTGSMRTLSASPAVANARSSSEITISSLIAGDRVAPRSWPVARWGERREPPLPAPSCRR